MGFAGVDWLSDPKVAIWTLMFIISWKYIGFAVILMIAGMQSIPEDLYEAAKVDGAGFWRRQWSITLPLLGPTIRIWAFMSIIGSLQLFDLVYIIWGQYVSSTAGTSTMATYMVREGRLANNYGYGSAVAVVIFIISLVIALTYQKFVLNRDLEGAITDAKDAKRAAKESIKPDTNNNVINKIANTRVLQ
jgi:raffinose/stachyose/melibiose transport system permease protein